MSGRRPPFPLRILDAVAVLPWWLSASLAVLGFVLLGRAAGILAAAGDGSAASTQVLTAALRVGQILLPLLFLFGAASAIGQKLKGAGVTGGGQAAPRQPRPGVLSWSELESLVSDVYTHQGYVVEKAGRGRDGGVELVLRRGSERFLVRCRHWQPDPIDADAIRELERVIAESSAHRGALVTPGDFTRDAVELSRQAGIELVGGRELDRLARNRTRLDSDRREPI